MMDNDLHNRVFKTNVAINIMDIDDLIADEEEGESISTKGGLSEDEISSLMGQTDSEDGRPAEEKVLIGRVEKYFSRIKVAAIQLTGHLETGDMIEINSNGKVLALKVSSMQIDKNSVDVADKGDSIGIKVAKAVKPGSDVYAVRQQ